MAGVPRNTATRDRHRRHIARGKPPCGICGEPIDYTLEHDDPWSYVVDHIIPRIKGGDDELFNKQAAHRCCNEDKGAKLEGELPAGITYVTARTW